MGFNGNVFPDSHRSSPPLQLPEILQNYALNRTRRVTRRLGIAVTKPDADIVVSQDRIPGLDLEGTMNVSTVFGWVGMNEELPVQS